MLIISLYIIIILLYAQSKKINAYNCFVEGVEDAYQSVKKLFPAILAIVISINVFLKSGIIEIFYQLNIPCIELFVQMLIKPFSWSTSLLMMTKIYQNYGVDSYYGRFSTLIQNGFDTTFYVLSIYLSNIKITKINRLIYTLIIANLCTYLFVGIILHFV